MITMALLSVLQIAAMLYFGIAVVRICRMQTLSKNLEWVAQDRSFIEKYHYPAYWPLYLFVIFMVGVIITGLIKQSSDFMLWGKNIGIIGAAIIVSVVYYAIEKQLAAKIPLRQERSASLVKRALRFYVHPAWNAISIGLAIFVVAAEIAAYLLHGISRVTFLNDITNAAILIPALFAGMYWALIEQIPHENDITTVTKVNVGENYRKFSLNLLTGGIISVSLLLLFQLTLQLNGYDIAISQKQGPFYRFFGENPQVFKPIFSLYQWNMVGTALTVPLCIFIARCKPFRDILGIKITPQEARS